MSRDYDEPRCRCGARDGEEHHRNCPQWDERAQVGVEIKMGDGEALYSRRGLSQTGFLTVRGTGAEILAAALAEVALGERGQYPEVFRAGENDEGALRGIAATAITALMRLKAGGA